MYGCPVVFSTHHFRDPLLDTTTQLARFPYFFPPNLTNPNRKLIKGVSFQSEGVQQDNVVLSTKLIM